MLSVSARTRGSIRICTINTVDAERGCVKTREIGPQNETWCAASSTSCQLLKQVPRIVVSWIGSTVWRMKRTRIQTILLLYQLTTCDFYLCLRNSMILGDFYLCLRNSVILGNWVAADFSDCKKNQTHCRTLTWAHCHRCIHSKKKRKSRELKRINCKSTTYMETHQ